MAIEKNREDEKRGAPLAGTSGLYGWTCKDCSAGTLSWSCDCQDENQYYRGTSTVWKWTCQGTELTNKDGCLQCETYSPAWGAVSPILAGIAMSPAWRRWHLGPQSLRLDSTVRSPHAHHHQLPKYLRSPPRAPRPPPGRRTSAPTCRPAACCRRRRRGRPRCSPNISHKVPWKMARPPTEP